MRKKLEILADNPSISLNGSKASFKINPIQKGRILLRNTNKANKDKLLKSVYDEIARVENFSESSEKIVNSFVNFIQLDAPDPTNSFHMSSSSSQPLKNIIVPVGTILYRVVKEESFVSRPKPELITKLGRFNDVNESVHYLSFTENTAQSEVPENNFLVKYRVKKGFSVSLTGEPQFQKKYFSNQARITGRQIQALYNAVLSMNYSQIPSSYLSKQDVEQRIYALTNGFLKKVYLPLKEGGSIGYAYPSVAIRNHSMILTEWSRDFIENMNVVLDKDTDSNDFIEVILVKKLI